ncbi:hypothetical protein F4553_004710 [Allocatelliglobosispora scoriae]|uniref:ESX-1 secretion-associated protein n=1 Tax=Allocatelliglobosispora scoriae TaxID=643052 RepID=A0A841BXB1_9ACTN|nr:hypothetical protein [Allocatelliglobosispora scoriae]MBB5871331.1 hypothetical protein [Allocatelliglobosispora scoriae]
MTELNRLGAELATASGQLSDARHTASLLGDDPIGSLAGAPGRLGEIGRRLSGQLRQAWSDRIDELGEAHADMDRLAEAVDRAVARYAQAEDHTRHGVGRLHAEEM